MELRERSSGRELAAAWFNTTSAPPTTNVPIAARASVVLAVEATAWAAPPTVVLTAPPTFPVTSCLPAVSSRPPFPIPAHPVAAAAEHAGGAAYRVVEAERGCRRRRRGRGARDRRERDRGDASGAAGEAHFAVVPRCWKKFTSPGPDPITSAAAAEITAAIRPRAA